MDADRLGGGRRRRPGRIAARVLVARSGDRLRDVPRGDRVHLHWVRRRRWSVAGHRRRVRSRWSVRGDRGGSGSPDRRGCWCSGWQATDSRTGGSIAATTWPTPAGGRRSALPSILSSQPSSPSRSPPDSTSRGNGFSTPDQRAERAMRSPRKAASSPTQPSNAEARVCCQDKPSV